MTAEILALVCTIMLEAGNCPRSEMELVASVIYNRRYDPQIRWGDSFESVCYYRRPNKKHGAFSCWDSYIDPRQIVVLEAARIKHESAEAWDTALDIAIQMHDGTFTPTTTANHYCALDLYPSWAERMHVVMRTAVHKYMVG